MSHFRYSLLLAFLLLTGTVSTGCDSSCSVKGNPEVPISGGFELTSQNGEKITKDAFKGRYTLVYFGYTFCPDVCPIDLQKISSALDMLGGDTSGIQPVFVTIDPARDTVDNMATYLEHFHPSIIGLTGSDEEIARATGDYKVYYAKAPDSEDDPNYLMNHSSSIYLMDCEGRYIRHFTREDTPETIARALEQLL